MKQANSVFYYLILSIVSGVMVLFLVLYKPLTCSIIPFTDKLIVASAFAVSCLLGISLAYRPGWIKRIVKHEINNVKKQQDQKTKRKYEGHHPDCLAFNTHSIRLNKKIYCAGCFGLSIGCFFCIILLIGYLIFNQRSKKQIYKC